MQPKSVEGRVPLISFILWMSAIRLEPLFLFFPMYDSPAQKDTWIAAFVAMIWVAVSSWVLYMAYRTFPGKSLADALELYLGPVS